MMIRIEYTDARVSATFVDAGPSGLWGKYDSSREDADAWLRAGHAARERRWMEVAEGCFSEGDLPDDAHVTFRWLVEECPPVAFAIMCGEWGAPRPVVLR